MCQKKHIETFGKEQEQTSPQTREESFSESIDSGFIAQIQFLDETLPVSEVHCCPFPNDAQTGSVCCWAAVTKHIRKAVSGWLDSS